MRCQTGCKVFDGSETLHHKDCAFYPESISKLYDELRAERDEMREVLKDCLNEINEAIGPDVESITAFKHESKLRKWGILE